MRLWIFDFDGTITSDAINSATTQLDPGCDALLRRLADYSSDQVVIVSNRNVYDIAERINIPGIIIGGCDGIELQLPSGYRVGPFREHEDELIQFRLNILPGLRKIVSGQSIEIEDKLWSIAVHNNKIKNNAWSNVVKKICTWSIKHGLTVSSGLDQIDIQLIPGFNKSVGISYLARMFNMDPLVDSIVYVGDDESDAIALWWTMLFGGTAIMVGNDLHVPGASYVEDSSALIAMIENIVEKP
jgi:trehalose 6-phosphate phosphatase